MLNPLISNSTPSDWPEAYTSCLELPPFKALESQFNLTSYSLFPSLTDLSSIPARLGNDPGVRFIGQGECDASGLYYEQFIDRTEAVPTRENSWHDLFNALMWRQFPLTKRLMNKMHVADISQYGLSPRTRKRDLLTHFDECGVILAVTDESMTSMLAGHQWLEAFVNHGAEWGKTVQPFIIGHALYEMLMQPYIGLTGKWMAVKVDRAFFDMPYVEQLRLLDTRVSQALAEDGVWQLNKPFKPLPVLGIPGWWEAQTPSFYANKDYFRPARAASKTPQKAPRSPK